MTIPRKFNFGEHLHEDSKLTFLYETEPKIYTYTYSDKVTTLRKGVFLCECGTLTNSFIGDVRRGKSLCCGCKGKEIRTQRFTTHGNSDHPLYGTWDAMRRRCDPLEGHKNYGKRGVRVCSRWLGDQGFERFIEDMGDKPEGTTLDRIDSNSDYSPLNCRWATLSHQGYNKRVPEANTSGAVGVSFDKFNKQWKATLGYQNKTVHLGRFELFEDAVEARRKAEVKYFGYNNDY